MLDKFSPDLIEGGVVDTMHMTVTMHCSRFSTIISWWWSMEGAISYIQECVWEAIWRDLLRSSL